MQIASHASAAVLAALIGLASGGPLHGAERGLRFQHLAAEDGLSNSWVHCILKDSRGFMWFGTADGLNRYDGSGITVYRHDPKDPNSLPSSSVAVLFEDSKKRLWVGAWRDGGLALYDRDKDRFTRFPYWDVLKGASCDVLNGVSDGRVSAIIEDKDGTLWLGTPNGVDRFDPEKGLFTHFRNGPCGPTGRLRSDFVQCLLQDRHGRLWDGTPDGLMRLDRRTGLLTRQSLGGSSSHGQEHPDVADLFEDSDGRLWVATLGDGLIRFDTATGETKRYLPDPQDPGSINKTWAGRLAGDGRGTLYVGTEGGGLNILDTQKERFTHFLSDPEDDTTPNSNSIWALRLDDQGILWIGTFNGGVDMLSPIGQRFHNIRARRDALSNPHVTAVLEDGRRDLWIATDGGGLNRFDNETRRFTYYLHDPANPGSISDDAVIALHEDSSGAIWAATWKGGLNRLDSRTGKFAHFRHDAGNPDSIIDDSTWAIFEEENGELVLATQGGVDFFDPRTERASRFSIRYPGAGEDPCDDVARDHSGNYWLATETGVDRVDARTRKVVHFTADPTSPTGLGMNLVHAIHVDSRGNVWLGTAGGGLNCVESDTGKWRRYTTANGLRGDNVVSILDDVSGNLWLGTDQGLSEFEGAVRLPDTLHFVNFDVRDGLQGQEFRPRAAFRARNVEIGDDELFFGGNRGLTSLFPNRIVRNPHRPPVVFTSLKILNRLVSIGTPGSPLVRQMSETQALTLSHEQSVVTFEFAALNYFVPRKNQYRVKLEGFDHDWNSMGTQRSATYTNLPPGRYVLRVKGANNDGVWNEAGASLRIRVTPPFWRTTWFLTLAMLLMIAGLLSGHRWRVAAHRARARELAERVEQRTADLKREIAERKLTEQRLQTERDLRHALMERELLAEERTRIARELHDSLAQNFAGLSLQLEAVAADLPPDAAEPHASLDVASRMVRHCQTEAHRAVWDLRSPVGESAPLKQMLEQALAPLLQAGKPHIEVEVDPQDAGLRPQMQRDVVRIAEEAVTNAVKHAAAARVSVTCRIRAEDVWLDVHDDGQGFEYDEDAPAPVGRFGLLGMRERAARISGRLEIASRPGVGTWVSLRCPEGLLSPRLKALREKIRREDGLDDLGDPVERS